MTEIKTFTRAEAEAERDLLIKALRDRFGTKNRADLRDLSFSGSMTADESALVDRLQSLDFLLDEK